jgi:hypothetical protein
VGYAEVTITTPPLKASPLRVGPMATAARSLEGTTGDGDGLTAVSLARAGSRTSWDMAALASVAGAVIASAVMTPGRQAARGPNHGVEVCGGWTLILRKVEMFLA